MKTDFRICMNFILIIYVAPFYVFRKMETEMNEYPLYIFS